MAERAGRWVAAAAVRADQLAAAAAAASCTPRPAEVVVAAAQGGHDSEWPGAAALSWLAACLRPALKA